MSGQRTDLSYDDAKAKAASTDAADRLTVAGHPGAPPEVLFFLANDPDPSVREAVAKNPATPIKADLVLTKDAEGQVRSGLAGKLAQLVPDLPEDERDRVRQTAVEVLEALARDHAVKVRQILSDTLKDVANAPPEVINQLARDTEILVSGPVLEFSPVLSDEDLLAIIGDTPASEALSAISRRSGVSGEVSEAIAETEDEQAIAFLLANESAQIREATLDGLIDLAADIPSWHDPLVRRPVLPEGAAARLAHFVADNLVKVLQAREDLDPATAREVARVVNRRIEVEHAPPLVNMGILKKTHEALQEQFKGRGLFASQVENDLTEGRTLHVIAGLAIRGHVAPEVAERILAAADPADVVSLAGVAWMPMPFAETLQRRVARVPEESVMKGQGSDYPLPREEMTERVAVYEARLKGA